MDSLHEEARDSSQMDLNKSNRRVQGEKKLARKHVVHQSKALGMEEDFILAHFNEGTFCSPYVLPSRQFGAFRLQAD